MSGELVGPATMPCDLGCPVPAGVTLAPVPLPRHNWPDVLVCPNEGCGRAWLVVAQTRPPTPDAQLRTAPHGDPLAVL